MNEKIDDDEDDDDDNNNNNWKRQKEAPRKVCNYHLNKFVIERYFLILSFHFYYSSNFNFCLSFFQSTILINCKGAQSRHRAFKEAGNEDKIDPFRDEFECPPLTGCSATSAVNNSQLNSSTGVKTVWNPFIYYFYFHLSIRRKILS